MRSKTNFNSYQKNIWKLAAKTSLTVFLREIKIGENQYKCKLCSSAFIRKHDFILHARFHTGFCLLFEINLKVNFIHFMRKAL